MNASDDPSKLAKNRLTEACQTKDTSLRVAWAITIGEAILLGVVALALMDYWLMLPVWMRSFGALGLVGLALLGVFRLVRFYRRPTRLKEAALDVEKQRPELGCEISTAAEYLSGERKMTQKYEPELVAALQAKAAEKLTSAQVRYEKKVLPPGILLAVTVLLFLGFLALAPVALIALQRTALPFSKAKYTSVEVKPGHLDIPVGRDVEITNIFSGRIPKDPQFHWQEDGPEANWKAVPLTRSTNGAYVHALKALKADVLYRVTGNDAESEQFKITTYVPPEVKEFNVEVNHPSYTKLKPVTQKSPDISAVRASSAVIRIQPSVELAKAKLRFSALPELAMEAGPDGSWSAMVNITKETDYWIELADKKGHVGVNEKPYHIKAVADNPPKVEIAEPAKDLRASATNKVPVKISVADDFGVDDIRVVFHKLGGSEQVVMAKREGEQNGEVTASAELDLSTLDLKEYELVAYHAEAKDNNTLDGPGLGKSQMYFVEITNEEGGPCLSQGQSQKVNLLVIQKQIIADTTALAANAAPEKFSELGVRQQDATEFARMYLEAISGGGASSAPAVNEMEAAIKDMEGARGFLEKQRRGDALPPEEGALAHLYQVLKLMPELENLPTTPPPPTQKPPPNPKVNVVLQAIKKMKKEQPDNKEIEEALQEAKDLARAQAGVNAAMRKQGDLQAEGEQAGKGKANSLAKNSSKSQGKGQGQGQGQGQGEGDGKPQENENEAAEQPAEIAEAKDPAQLSEKEDQLSKEAAALAQKLQRLAGKNTRVGHNPGKGAAKAANKMSAAAQAMKGGGFGAAGEHGFQGELALRSVIAQLEHLLKNQPEPTDIANEDFPKEYEAVIAEYLKKLSHAE